MAILESSRGLFTKCSETERRLGHVGAKQLRRHDPRSCKQRSNNRANKAFNNRANKDLNNRANKDLNNCVNKDLNNRANKDLNNCANKDFNNRANKALFSKDKDHCCLGHTIEDVWRLNFTFTTILPDCLSLYFPCFCFS